MQSEPTSPKHCGVRPISYARLKHVFMRYEALILVHIIVPEIHGCREVRVKVYPIVIPLCVRIYRAFFCRPTFWGDQREKRAPLCEISNMCFYEYVEIYRYR
jgi:hypothetical protein